jgi:hypothetical protein
MDRDEEFEDSWRGKGIPQRYMETPGLKLECFNETTPETACEKNIVRS